MKLTLTIAKRELTSYFYSPVAYLVIGVFALVSTLFFFRTFMPGQPATLRVELQSIVWLLVFITPAISMRLISEELDGGTLELLMTAPITDAQLIIGKWLGATAFFAVMMAPVIVHVAVLEINGSPDYGPIFTGLLGIMLIGGLYLAIGTFISATSRSQLIAFIFTLLVTGFLTIGMYLLAIVEMIPASIKQAMHYLNVNQQFSDFAKGLIDITNLVYFVSGIALFLFFAVMTLQSRRWR